MSVCDKYNSLCIHPIISKFITIKVGIYTWCIFSKYFGVNYYIYFVTCIRWKISQKCYLVSTFIGIIYGKVRGSNQYILGWYLTWGHQDRIMTISEEQKFQPLMDLQYLHTIDRIYFGRSIVRPLSVFCKEKLDEGVKYILFHNRRF